MRRNDELIDVEVHAGGTLAEVVARAGLELEDGAEWRAMAGGEIVPFLNEYTPEPGELVTLRMVPEDPISITVGILAAIATIGELEFLVHAGALGIAALTGAAIVVGVAAGLLSHLAIASLTPDVPKPAAPGSGRGSRNSITGARNQERPFEPIGKVYGTTRVFLDLAARPYTEVIGDDTFLRMLFTAGPGEISWDTSSFKIGDTLLSSFDDVEFAVREGKASDPALSIYPGIVHELPIGAKLLVAGDGENGKHWQISPLPFEPGEWIERTAAGAGDELTWDIFFPRGHFDIHHEKGEFQTVSWFEMQTRVSASDPAGPSAWSVVSSFDGNIDGRITIIAPGGDVPADIPWHGIHQPTTNPHSATVIRFTAHEKAPTLVGFRKKMGAKRIYDVRIRKVYTSGRNQVKVTQSLFQTLRAFDKETSPIKDPLPGTSIRLSTCELRVKANDQLRGVLDTFNGIVSSKVRTWDGAAWTSPVITRNPAWHTLDMLQGMSFRPEPDSNVNFDRWKTWADIIEANQWYFDGILRDLTTNRAARVQVMQVARGTPGRDERGRHIPIIDVAQSGIKQLWTRRNVRSWQGQILYPDLPHALRMPFQNRELEYVDDERKVFRDGYNEDGSGGKIAATKYETVETFGMTDPDRVWQDGRFKIKVGETRRELHTIETDFEHLVTGRGDLVGVSWDTPHGDVWSARVLSVSDPTFVVDAPFTYQVGSSYAVRIRLDDGSSITGAVVNPATTDPVESTTVTMVVPFGATVPAEGDLVDFGLAARTDHEAIIKSIVPTDELGATLVLIPYDASVYSTDDTGGPEYDPHDPQTTTPEAARPPAPTIRDIVSEPGELVAYVQVTHTPQQRRAVRYQAQFRGKNPTGAWVELASIPVVGSDRIAFAPVVEGRVYDIRIRTDSGLGTFSDWVQRDDLVFSAETIFASLFSISGLELEGQGNGLEFTGGTAAFRWNLNVPTITADTITSPGDRERFKVDLTDPFFRGYRVQVLDPFDGDRIHHESFPVLEAKFEYTPAMQAADRARTGKGPLREFKLRVTFVDILENESEAATIQPRNPAPRVPADFKAFGAFQQVWAAFTQPRDLDYLSTLVFVSVNPGVTATPDFQHADQKGSPIVINNNEVIDRDGGVETGFFYVRIAPYDEFARDPETGVVDVSVLEVSDEIQVAGEDLELAEGSVLGFAELIIPPSARMDSIIESAGIFGAGPTDPDWLHYPDHLGPLGLHGVGQWVTVMKLELTTVGRRVHTGSQMAVDITRVSPPVLGAGGVEDPYLLPTILFRVVRFDQSATTIEQVVYESDLQTISLEGFYQAGTLIPADADPPPGTHVWGIQVMKTWDVFRFGTVSRSDVLMDPTQSNALAYWVNDTPDGSGPYWLGYPFPIAPYYLYMPSKLAWLRGDLTAQRWEVRGFGTADEFSPAPEDSWIRVDTGGADLPDLDAQPYEIDLEPLSSLGMDLTSGFLWVAEPKG